MMNKQIFCEENQKNNNAENFKSDNIIPESLKNKSIKDLEEILSKIKYPEETNQHLNPNLGTKVENNYEDLENDKKYECFELFISLELPIDTNINNQMTYSFDKVKEIMPEMPDYCRMEYNNFCKSIYDAIKNKFTNESKIYTLKFNFEEESDVNTDSNTDKNNKEFVDNDKMKNESYDDELEQYYLKSRKDCVEYGLKSLDEDLIVCTKYE
jgi:hypothetical protein